MKELWRRGLSEIESIIGRQSFETWIRPTKLVSIEGAEVTISVPSRFFRDWVTENYSEIIGSSLSSVMGKRPTIKFVIEHDRPQEASREADKAAEKERPQAAYVPPPFLNPKYTFSNFVVGSSNQFAHAACMAVADMPARAYNPLFIYGGSGLGKTHLLHAIGHQILGRHRGMRVCYVSSERFINDLISSLQRDCMHEFRNRYRNMDLLLVDDIHYIAGKERTQEEFFHTFNTLHESHRQIIISADTFPKEIAGLEERLRSRFEWGLIADIQPPDLETKVAILNQKAVEQRIDLPRDVAHLIAGKIKHNIRELEGCLLRITADSSITGRPIDTALAEEILNRIFASKERRITIDSIQRAVARAYNLRVSDLKSKKRIRTISKPRQVAMYISRNYTKASLPEIGRLFGGKDHTTVIHSCNKIERLLETDKELERKIQNIVKGLEE